jgi:hypothetical protein
MKILKLFNFLSQNDPASPVDGDVWRNLARLKFRNGSTTEQVAHLSDLKVNRHYQFSYMSVGTAAISPFGKATTSTAAYPASDYPTTLSGSGLVNANTDPYVVLNNCIAKRIRITLGSAAVQQATAGASPMIRISLYKAALSSARTLIGNFDIPLVITSGSMGVNSTVSNVYATGISGIQNFLLSGGDAIGIEFTPVTTNNNWIASAGRMIAVLETEE